MYSVRVAAAGRGGSHRGLRPIPGRRPGLVGYVPQQHEFAWEFPIDVQGAVLTAVLARHGPLRRPRPADRAAVLDALDRVGLADLRQRPIGQLSGGQRQRVLVARALAIAPRLMLLDEAWSWADRLAHLRRHPAVHC